jgi:hypothetical protein
VALPAGDLVQNVQSLQVIDSGCDRGKGRSGLLRREGDREDRMCPGVVKYPQDGGRWPAKCLDVFPVGVQQRDQAAGARDRPLGSLLYAGQEIRRSGKTRATLPSFRTRERFN